VLSRGGGVGSADAVPEAPTLALQRHVGRQQPKEASSALTRLRVQAPSLLAAMLALLLLLAPLVAAQPTWTVRSDLVTPWPVGARLCSDTAHGCSTCSACT